MMQHKHDDLRKYLYKLQEMYQINFFQTKLLLIDTVTFLSFHYFSMRLIKSNISGAK